MILAENGPLTRIEKAGLALALLVSMVLMWHLRGYITDDTYIHLQYARNLAAGNGFVFNPGENVYGSTSPLWVALIADGIALGFDGLVVAKWLGAIATLWSVVLFLQLLRRDLRMPALRAMAVVTWACHAWMLRWSVSGMETPLAVALVLAGFVAFTEGEQWGARPVRTGALWALAALTRPEAVFLLVLWGIFLIIDTDSRAGLRRLIFGALPPVVIYGGWLVYARVTFGTFWPNTLAAKVAGGEGWDYFLGQTLRQVQIIGATDAALVGALFAALMFAGRRFWPREWRAQRLLPWVWVGALPVLYTMRGVPVLSRYLLPLLPILAWLAWRAVERWWSGDAPRPSDRRGAAILGLGLMLLSVVPNLLVYQQKVVPQVESLSAGMRSSLIPWGKWVRANTPEGAMVAAPDIGAVGYFSERRVLDLAGLVTPGMVPILGRMPQEQAVAQFEFAAVGRPDALMDRAPRPFDLMDRSPFAPALTPVGHASLPNLGISRPGEAVYTVYRISWPVADSIRRSRASGAH